MLYLLLIAIFKLIEHSKLLKNQFTLSQMKYSHHKTAFTIALRLRTTTKPKNEKHVPL